MGDAGGAGPSGWALNRTAMAAAMTASSPPPEGELEDQQRSHIVTRRSPDYQAGRLEMAQMMGAASPPSPTMREAADAARGSARSAMAAAMSNPSPGGEYVGGQPAMRWRSADLATATGTAALQEPDGECEECAHPADLSQHPAAAREHSEQRPQHPPHRQRRQHRAAARRQQLTARMYSAVAELAGVRRLAVCSSGKMRLERWLDSEVPHSVRETRSAGAGARMPFTAAVPGTTTATIRAALLFTLPASVSVPA